MRFHDLRHTTVALLIGQGAQQYEVIEHLGHSNVQTTINTYGHLFPNVRERIRAALEDVWDAAFHRSPTDVGDSEHSGQRCLKQHRGCCLSCVGPTSTPGLHARLRQEASPLAVRHR
jgi:hypothetical protein